MGNNLFLNFNLEKNEFMKGGFKNLWKIYKGTNKISNKKICAFICDKNSLPSNLTQESKESLINILKLECSNLIKYKHPNILSVEESIKEDKNLIGFITEEFDTNFEDYVNEIYNKKNYLEIKKIFIELINVILFLNKDCNIIHNNLNPNSLFIKDGKLKLSGMNFSQEILNNKKNEFYLNLNEEILNFDLNYCAPEIVYENKINIKSDIFSIGILLFNYIQKNYENNNKFLCLSLNLPSNYKKIYNNYYNNNNYSKNENEIFEKTLIKNSENRIELKKILNLKYFKDVLLQSIIFLENLNTNEKNENILFLENFKNFYFLFEKEILKIRILPIFLNNLNNENLLNFLIPNIFIISDFIKNNFELEIFNKIKFILKLKIIPAKTLYFLLKKIPFFIENISKENFNENFLEIICKSLDCNVSKIQFVIIKNIKKIAENFYEEKFKKEIFPRINKILLNSNDVELKIKIIYELKNIFFVLDKNLIENLIKNLNKVINENENNIEINFYSVDFIDFIKNDVNNKIIYKNIFPFLGKILANSKINVEIKEKINEIFNNLLKIIEKNRENEINNDEINFIKNDENNNNFNDDEKNYEKAEKFLEKFFNKKDDENKINNNKNFDFDDFDENEFKIVKKDENKIKKINKWDEDDEDNFNEEKHIKKIKKIEKIEKIEKKKNLWDEDEEEENNIEMNKKNIEINKNEINKKNIEINKKQIEINNNNNKNSFKKIEKITNKTEINNLESLLDFDE